MCLCQVVSAVRPCVFVPGGVSSKSYDDVDEQALHRMTKERVEWSTQEDSMVGGLRPHLYFPYATIITFPSFPTNLAVLCY